jgi:hypothetical protein
MITNKYLGSSHRPGLYVYPWFGWPSGRRLKFIGPFEHSEQQCLKAEILGIAKVNRTQNMMHESIRAIICEDEGNTYGFLFANLLVVEGFETQRRQDQGVAPIGRK